MGGGVHGAGFMSVMDPGEEAPHFDEVLFMRCYCVCMCYNYRPQWSINISDHKWGNGVQYHHIIPDNTIVSSYWMLCHSQCQVHVVPTSYKALVNATSM